MKLDDIVGQEHLIGEDGVVRRMVNSGRLMSMILWGPAGTGKTTLAYIIAESTGYFLEPVSAVTSGVKEIREALDRAKERLGMNGQRTVLFIDEVHRFNKSQQDLLLPATESGLVVLIGATTENPFFEVNPALMSRTSLFRLQSLRDDQMNVLIDRASHALGISITGEARLLLVAISGGDARVLFTAIEAAAFLMNDSSMTDEHVSRAREGRYFKQNRDARYDQMSAFIKSIRGSDPDAALYWLANLLEGGEDPRVIARRLLVAASEDIGLADASSISVAHAACEAVLLVGLPEARINLAHAVIHLALAPKSNSVITAFSRALEAVSQTEGEVPPHLRDAHYGGAASIGHGQGYLYPHDYEGHWVAQNYLPDGMSDVKFYEPSNEGQEPGEASRWRKRQAGD